MHILNGDSAAGAFRQVYQLPVERILVFRDVLSCGELKHYTNMDEWFSQRTHYWSQCLQDNGLGAIDESDQMPQDLYCHLEDLKRQEQIHLSIGCALSDQLLLVFVVMLFDYYRLDFNKLHIRQYLTFDQKGLTITGLGLLNPDAIKAIEPQAHSLTPEEVRYCLSVWEAITSDSPNKLLEILEHENPALPTLHTALQNLLYRYPDKHKGLSRFDEIMLEQILAHGPKATHIIAHTLAHDTPSENSDDIHQLDTVGDLYLFARLKRLAQLKKPLLKLNTLSKTMRDTTVQLTDFGLEVLQGHHNAIKANGIDDWVCGVHLTADNLWLRDGKSIRAS